MKMYACYIVYNNENTIKRSLKSVVPFVEKVIMIDGAFKHYPYYFPFSTDKTYDIAKRLCGEKLTWRKATKRHNQIVLPWRNQIEKRNRCLTLVPVGEHFIAMDDDTYLTGEVKREFRNVEEEGYTCAGIRNINEIPIWEGEGLPPKDVWQNIKWRRTRGISKRIYLKQKRMKYIKHHSTIYKGKKNLSKPQYILRDVKLINGRAKRTWEQHVASIIYKIRRPEFKKRLLNGSPTPQRILDWYCGGVMPSDKEIDDAIKQIVGIPLFKFYNILGKKYPETKIVYATNDGITRFKVIRKLLKKRKGLILDLGCNTGVYEPYIQEYVGLDIALACLKKFKNQRIFGIAEILPFRKKMFDVVLASEIIEHLKHSDRLKALKECRRVLKRNGELIMSTPLGDNPYNIKASRSRWSKSNFPKYNINFQVYHHGLFSAEYCKKLLHNTGFKVTMIHKIGSHHIVVVGNA